MLPSILSVPKGRLMSVSGCGCGSSTNLVRNNRLHNLAVANGQVRRLR